ncbi:MAG: hypothetical protein FJ313_07405 [Gemmatimonadetes bacterium]|nr:hypothetical protein [Gemmatimonadota bacterium]
MRTARTRSPLDRRNESGLTHRLKWAAWNWLYHEAGCRAIAFEVRLEGPAGRIADLVAVGPANRVYLVEVKSSRPDAARDRNTPRDAERLRDRTTPLAGAVTLTAGILEAAASHARFADPLRWKHDAAYRLALAEHRRAVRRQAAHDRRLKTFSTKFHDPAYLRLGHCHYIIAPAGVLRPAELPPFWGLLDETPALLVEAPVKQIPDATTHVLRAIARANTRDLMATAFHP